MMREVFTRLAVFGVSVGPFDHAAIDWNPQGHPPPMVDTVPHFGFHFYMIPTSEQMTIAGGT